MYSRKRITVEGPPLLGNGSVSTFPRQRIESNTRTGGDGDLYSIRLEVSSVQLSSFGKDSSFVIRHSGREDTRNPVRNGASLRQSLTVSSRNLFNCKNLPVNPIMQSRSRYYSSRNPGHVTVFSNLSYSLGLLHVLMVEFRYHNCFISSNVI
jgi:hypothetical protein